MDCTISHKERAAHRLSGANHLRMIDDHLKKASSTKAEHDLDASMWNDHAKGLLAKGVFPQSMDMDGILDKLDVTVRNGVVEIGTGEEFRHLCATKQLSYPLYYSGTRKATLMPSADHAVGARGGLIKASCKTGGCSGIIKSNILHSTGVESSLVQQVGVTQANQLQTRPLECRLLALKGVMLLRQLVLLHSSETGVCTVEAKEISHDIKVRGVKSAMDELDNYNVLANVDCLSKKQLNILSCISEEWPCQQLVTPQGMTDIYSRLRIARDNLCMYKTQGAGGNHKVKGMTITPAEYWTELTQLFNNMGCLDQLAEVVRDTRGIAPILNFVQGVVGDTTMYLTLEYPPSYCIIGMRPESLRSNLIKPTMLECSTNVLILDNLMLTLFVNNCHFLGENMGMMSRLVVPPNCQKDRVDDLLNCFGVSDRSITGVVNEYLTPWLTRLGMWGRSAMCVVRDLCNRGLRGDVHPLAWLSLSLEQSVQQVASSLGLIRKKMNIECGEGGGLCRDRSEVGHLIEVSNWAKALGILPGASVDGVSGVGLELTSRDYSLLDTTFCNITGTFMLRNYQVSVGYSARAGDRFRFMDTFFYTTKCLGPVDSFKPSGDEISARPNSFVILDQDTPSCGAISIISEEPETDSASSPEVVDNMVNSVALVDLEDFRVDASGDGSSNPIDVLMSQDCVKDKRSELDSIGSKYNAGEYSDIVIALGKVARQGFSICVEDGDAGGTKDLYQVSDKDPIIYIYKKGGKYYPMLKHGEGRCKRKVILRSIRAGRA